MKDKCRIEVSYWFPLTPKTRLLRSQLEGHQNEASWFRVSRSPRDLARAQMHEQRAAEIQECLSQAK